MAYSKYDLISEAMKNGGILPESFNEHKEFENDPDFVYDLLINTHKIENFTKFEPAVTENFLKLHPECMSLFWESDLISKDFLTNVAEKYPETLEYLPDNETIMGIVQKQPESIYLTSYEFKTRPEAADLIKKILRGEIKISDEALEHLMFSHLPYTIRNDKELFRAFISNNPDNSIYYQTFGKDIKNDLELTEMALKSNPNAILHVGEELLKSNPAVNEAYFTAAPYRFAISPLSPKNTTNEELIEKVLRHDLGNFDLLTGEALETETAKKVRFGLDRLRKLQENVTSSPNLTTDKNMTYDLISDKEIMSLPDETLKSLLEYDTQPCYEILEIAKNKELPYLREYLDLVYQETGKNQRSAYNAITTYKYVAPIMREVHTFGQGSLSFYDKRSLHHIVATKNPYGIKSLSELKEYPQKLKEECLASDGFYSMKEKVFQVFGYQKDNFNPYHELSRLQISFPELADRHPVADFLETIYQTDNLEALKELIEKTDFKTILKAPTTVYKSMSLAYENEYRKSFSKISDIETSEIIDGVEVKKLDGKPFKMLMHRIFNFDKSLSENVKILMETPEKWATLTGASYISTSFISDKSIKGVMRPLKDGSDLVMLADESEQDLKERAAYDKKEKLKPTIDDNAVFLGFTSIPEGSLLRMASMDAMTEHGGRHAEVKTDVNKFYFPDDLAYKTTRAWNEVVITRENPQNGERIIPDCIICFDGKINESSLKWAKTWKLPIVMIDRDKYIQANKRIRRASMAEFRDTLSPEALKKTLYSTSMEDLIDFKAKEILKAIKTNEKTTNEDKLKALTFMEEHFDRLIDYRESCLTYRSWGAEKLREMNGQKVVGDYEKVEKIKREIQIQKKAFSHFAENNGISHSQKELDDYIHHEHSVENSKKPLNKLNPLKPFLEAAAKQTVC